MRTNHFFVTIPPKKGDAAICGYTLQTDPVPYIMGECAQWCMNCCKVVRDDLKVQIPYEVAS